MQVLGIETSCDETGIAIFSEKKGLLAHEVYSQIKEHAPYGGVVPEIASRDHIKKIIPLINQILQKSNSEPKDISAIAYTKGPGLHGALMVGCSFAKALGYAWGIPSIGIHHLEGHLLAVMLEKEKPSFPFVALIVSGGHSMLVKVTKVGNYVVIGDCVDDAAGEAFDKIGKLLGLPYPGGPEIEKLAKKGDSSKFSFPRPLTDRISLDFSFSGLKTHTIKTFKEQGSSNQSKADIAAAFQEAVIDTLYKKCKWALEETKLKQLVVAGGVGANKMLKTKLNELCADDIKIFFPRGEFCTDNGAMIAYSGLQHLKHDNIDNDLVIAPHPRWKIEEIFST